MSFKTQEVSRSEQWHSVLFAVLGLDWPESQALLDFLTIALHSILGFRSESHTSLHLEEHLVVPVVAELLSIFKSGAVDADFGEYDGVGGGGEGMFECGGVLTGGHVFIYTG